MNTPIIDPSTLTEEQRNEIRSEYDYNANMSARYGGDISTASQKMSLWYQGKCYELINIFGKDFFKKGE